MAAQATLHCLTGCAVGEILGMVLGTAFGLHNGATVVLSILLAFVFGYALTMRGVRKAGLDVGAAVKVALAADTVSILVMELIDNTVMVTVPGAMDAGFGDLLFWVALAGSLAGDRGADRGGRAGAGRGGLPHLAGRGDRRHRGG
ncbi:DUF4396 domain-containing protein, partial [Kitasatospora sp. NPDC036755]|uniref:DUF4396 domain-containing protein n=1 Tax=Kitasatospora sp. NPDC036755 TaxID=3154600 RepID=UPI0033ECEB14